jgi:hypothetical protein
VEVHDQKNAIQRGGNLLGAARPGHSWLEETERLAFFDQTSLEVLWGYPQVALKHGGVSE